MSICTTRKLVAALLFSICVCSNLYAQMSDYSFPNFGPYRTNGTPPKGFEDFHEFILEFREGENQLQAKFNEHGSLLIAGILKTGGCYDASFLLEGMDEHNRSGTTSQPCIEYKFEIAKLNHEGRLPDKVFFITKTVDSIKYQFEGQFLSRPKFSDGMYITLTGTLTKYKDEHVMSKAELKLVNWTYE